MLIAALNPGISVCPQMNLPLRFAGRLAVLLAAALLIVPSTPLLAADKERDDCARNLQTIWNALQKHRAQQKSLPSHLSQLLPEHLSSPNALICPVTRRTGEINNRGFSDPAVSSSYIYEFSSHIAPGMGENSAMTLRDWRQLQMGQVGSVVPIVRCLHHGRVLNMSFDGKLYESAGEWEADLANLVEPESLSPSNVLQQVEHFLTGVRASRITTVDLSKFYNARLDQSLHESNPQGPSFAGFPAGRNRFGDVPFEVGGVIQLLGQSLKAALPNRYSTNVTGIPVNRHAAALYFLGGAGWNVQTKDRIGHFKVHYEDGESVEIPIIYGVHFSDWWNEPPPGSTELKLAWLGRIGRAEPNRDQTGRVYQFRWPNPRTLVPIKSIDFVSQMANPAPFLLGLSVEQP